MATMALPNTSHIKKPGRPPSASSRRVFEILLKVAERFLKEKSPREITIRELAAQANVSTAMINYYFHNKEGLFTALIGHLFSNWESAVKQLIEEIQPGSSNPNKEFAELVNRCFYQHEPVIKLLYKEMSAEQSAIQAYYNEHLSSRIAKSIRSYLAKGIQTGHFRNQPDLRYAAMSISMLAIYPIALDQQFAQNTYDIGTKEFRSRQWLAHVEDSLNHMLAVPGRHPS